MKLSKHFTDRLESKFNMNPSDFNNLLKEGNWKLIKNKDFDKYVDLQDKDDCAFVYFRDRALRMLVSIKNDTLVTCYRKKPVRKRIALG